MPGGEILWDKIFKIITAGGLIFIGIKLNVLNTLVKTVNLIKENLKLVTDSWSFGIPFDAAKLKVYSPVQVTEQGLAYLEQTGFISAFAEHANDFYTVIDQEKPTTDYDIENLAIRSVIQLFHHPYFVPIKDYFYNHPQEDRNSFIRIAGTYVRNKYMEHKQQITQ